jgi:N-acetylmuramoyl-L-alanine amidase
VPENKRAWHAGISSWKGEKDINSCSIGIEIVNGGHNYLDADGKIPKYKNDQLKAVIALSKRIINQHGKLEFLGHSDIAPSRKKDPGEHFPWEYMASEGLGKWPLIKSDDRRALFEFNDRDRGVSIVQTGLAKLGYSACVTGVMDQSTVDIIFAIQRRYRQDQVDGILDIMTMEIIKSLLEI